ncbi:MAG: hypothetical protein QGG96_02095 [Candidatus Poseidoniaceae archaeon]|jgi:shikimate kinase|nr:hypothetical protein [Candidatus Poseidoniaceae archaeon]
MAVLGTGTANGACSLLHAAGVGYGASLTLDLPVKVRLMDKASKKVLDDPDSLLDSVLTIWKNAELPLPQSDELHWTVRSEIPPRQGLKSSAAVAIAALRALCDATDSILENHQLVDLAAAVQIDAGVSLTGSIDDAWAAAESGWKLIDINAENAESGVILEGDGPPADEWSVFVITRGERVEKPNLEAFSLYQQAFSQALSALQEGKDLVALTWNGRGMNGVLNDTLARRLTNDAFVNGARSAGISGSGPAIVIFAPSISKPICERLSTWYGRFDEVEVIETKVINPSSPKGDDS